MYLLFILFFTSVVNSQMALEQMLGKSKKEIQTTMNAQSEYTASNFGISTNDQTLRYYNAKKDITLIFYFDTQQKCKHIKWIEDIEHLNERISTFNQKYKKSNQGWAIHAGNKEVKIDIDKDEYNYSVNYHF